MRGSFRERFNAKWRLDSDTGCWLWTAHRKSKGYGQLSRTGQHGGMAAAHRASWELHRGPIPDGLWVLHHCDTPPCVNPDHLFLGTHADNVADMIAKGRPGGPYRRGESHCQAKLTEADVRKIRAAKGLLLRELAAQYGVSPNTIGKVRRREQWAHVS